MKINLTNPNQLSREQISQVAELAGQGFERRGDPDMYEDTVRHVQSAEYIHLAYEAEKLVAFSMYQRSLWRLSI